jgi:hypothetical protein
LLLSGYLHLQNPLCHVNLEELNRETVSSAVQHLLRNGDNETVRVNRMVTIANPRRAMNIHATLRINNTLRREVVYPVPAQGTIIRDLKQATNCVG